MIVFHKYRFCIVWNLVIAKIIFIFQIYICFEAIQSGGKSSRMLQAWTEVEFIKFFMAEKCKQLEIYRRMCGVYREAYFSQKMFTNGLNMDLPQWAWIKMTIYRMETHWLFGKEKVPGAAASKEGHADSVLEHERTHFSWFFFEKVQLQTGFPIANSLVKIHLIYVMTSLTRRGEERTFEHLKFEN